jgi:acyl-CoA dehydrogenase
MAEHVYPAEHAFQEQVERAHPARPQPPILETLKLQARSRGLWNFFLPHAAEGHEPLSNAEYAPLAEITGRSPFLAPEALNCSPPDTGNMELLAMFETPEQKERWLRPLLDGRIRSSYAMTEPRVASSDASNIETSILRDGDD